MVSEINHNDKSLALGHMVSSYARENNIAVMFIAKEKENHDGVTFIIENMNGINANMITASIVSQEDIVHRIIRVYLETVFGLSEFEIMEFINADIAGKKQ